MTLTTLGIDLAKSVFQLHGIDEEGSIVLRKKVRRNALLNTLRGLSPCLVGMEACATSHYWAREIMALGHEVKLLPPAYVKPYVKRQKMMRPMPRRYVKLSPDRQCALWR